jgi:hypothetical protein
VATVVAVSAVSAATIATNTPSKLEGVAFTRGRPFAEWIVPRLAFSILLPILTAA